MKKSTLLKSALIGVVCASAAIGSAGREKVIRVFSDGSVIAEYNAADIDYIQIDDLIGAPGDVTADAEGTSISISWGAVEGATYDVYRSPDDANYSLIASGLTETSYTDRNPLDGTNYYRVKAMVNGKESGYTETVSATLPDSCMESGIYLGVLGFNSALYEYPIMRLDETTVGGFHDFIDGLEKKDMTLLYYSVEQALDRMQATAYPADLSQVALVTFTDGLDRGSHGKTDAYYDSEDGDLDYRNDLNRRITTQTVAGKKISAYSIGIRGSDVRDVEKFQDNIRKLASSPENAYEVTNMSEVNARFKEIAEKLTKSTNIQSFTVRIPPEANGSVIRFTFDNMRNNAEKSKVWIQGVLDLRTKSLGNIEAGGLEFTTPVISVAGTEDEEGFYCYTFSGIVTDNDLLLTPSATHEHIYIKSNSTWQANSEFGREGDFVPKVDRSSAAIMLVLDCTSSLGDMFDKTSDNAKDNAKTFIKTLYDAYGNDPYSPLTPPSYGDETITVNGVSFRMVAVNGGTFRMGSTVRDDEKPIHSETLESFKIGETEVTQGLWRAVMGSNPSYYTGDDSLPVENVSWEDCMNFISLLNKMTGKYFRLPTEAEWEYAARGGEKSKNFTYSGGDDIDEVAWYYANSGGKTHPVAEKLPNELGIYDMSGNVCEWTSDKWSADYSSPRNSAGCVIRGGSLDYDATGCRVAYRNVYTPSHRGYNLGLRLAL